jgi:hypothetical protein
MKATEYWNRYIVFSHASLELMRPTSASRRWSGALPSEVPPEGPSAFDLYARQLGLAPEEYADSRKLREWCRENKHRCYIPEWLLKHWGITVRDSQL